MLLTRTFVWTAAFSAMLLLGCVPEFRASTVIIVPDADTTLIESAPANNNGGEAWVNAGTTQNGPRNRGLFHFDLSFLPTNTVVIGAALTLEVTHIPSEGYAISFFGLRRMLRPWGEGASVATNNGGGQGAFASAGGATWLYSFSPTNAWTVPGGAPGVDFAAFESSSKFIEGKGSYFFESTAEMIADVTDWVRSPSANHGWMLLCGSEEMRFTARRFASREDLINPPSLQVDYLVVPRIEAYAKTASGFTLRFTPEADQAYWVEYRDALGEANWSTLTNLGFVGTAGPISVTDTNAVPLRFYRVRTN